MIYSRTQLLPGVSAHLPLQKSIIIVGCGGVGTPAALYLASLVKKLVLVDCDVVEEHNLNRQLAYGMCDVGQPKCELLATKIRELSPQCEVSAVRREVNEGTVATLCGDFLIDATDNAPTRFVLGRYCKDKRIPQIYASASMFYYNIALFNADAPGPCFHCLLGDKVPPEALQAKSAKHGIFGPAAGICGSTAAAQCFFYFTDRSKCVRGLLVGDVRLCQQKTVRIAYRCAGCAKSGASYPPSGDDADFTPAAV